MVNQIRRPLTTLTVSDPGANYVARSPERNLESLPLLTIIQTDHGIILLADGFPHASFILHRILFSVSLTVARTVIRTFVATTFSTVAIESFGHYKNRILNLSGLLFRGGCCNWMYMAVASADAASTFSRLFSLLIATVSW